ncbi:putative lipid-binding transport protein (Tim44 family) [Gammaproteobacteria bacterium]
MQKTLLGFFIALLSLVFTMSDVEAARLGGGKSLGRQSPSYSRQAPSPSQPPSYNTAPRTPPSYVAPPASSGARRWLGPLAGLAAGGLLASLFLGHGFEGLQFLDILIILGLGVGIYFLVRTLRGRNQIASSEERLATVGEVNAARFQNSDFGSGLTNTGVNARPLDVNHLAWFNEESFLKNARTYFLSLQSAWDANRMEEIEEYVTPELYRELVSQRATLGPNFTEVVKLDVNFLGLATEGDTVFAGVRYSGLIREQKGTDPQPFTETWHVQRSLSEPNANWHVAGIQQG